MGLEKSRQSHNSIESLRDDINIIQYDDDTILQIAKDFYSDLYTSKQTTENLYKVNSYQKSTTPEKQLNADEATKCKEAIWKMKTNKSPGLDGISIEFYRVFCDKISKLLMDVFNESYEIGELTESQRTCVLSLIYKKGDQENIKNYSANIYPSRFL